MALTKRQVYLYGAGASAIGRGAELVAAFATMWLLTHMLPREDYGYYVVAFTLIELIGLVAAGGMESVVVYRSSRLDAPPGQLAGAALAGSALARGVLASLAVAAVVALAAPALAALFDKPAMEGWIRGLALLLPILVARSIYAAWHRGRQRLAQSILLGQSAPKLAAVVGLALVFALAPGRQEAIVAALVGTSLLTLVGWMASAPPGPLRLRGQLDAWDLRYGLKLMLTALMSRGSRATEVLLLGALATGGVTALFSVGASLASLALLPHNVLGRIFAPRLGWLYSRRQREELRREYDQTRSLAFGAALAGAVLLAGFGEPALRLFGDYERAEPMMLIVAAAYLTQSSLGVNSTYLVMAGYGGWSLVLNLAQLGASAVLNLLLIPHYGGVGSAAAAFGSIALVKGATSLVVWRLDRFATQGAELALVNGACVALLWLAALGAVPARQAAAALLALLGYFLYRQRGFWIPEIGRLASRPR